MNYSAPARREGIPLVPSPNIARERGLTALTRACIATAARAADNNVRPGDYARRTWGAEAASVELILRAATSPAQPTTAGWAQELAHVTLTFLASLVGVSAGADLLSRATQVRFDGNVGVTFPNITTTTAGFIGSGKPIPVAQLQTSTGVRLDPHGFKIITVLTREMIESSNAETIVRTALVDSARLSLDGALFGASAATADAPPGLLYGIAATTPSASTIPSEAMVEDLATLGSKIARVAGDDIVFIAAPEQALAIRLRAPDLDYPVLSSSALAAKTVIAIAAPALVSGYEPVPQIDVSTETTLHMDTTPQEIVSADGSFPPGVVATMFQGDKLALRLRMPLAWVLRAANAIAFMNNVAW
jgi:hypothetical protein